LHGGAEGTLVDFCAEIALRVAARAVNPGSLHRNFRLGGDTPGTEHSVSILTAKRLADSTLTGLDRKPRPVSTFQANS
jgi:hypothetical protein